MINRRAVTIAWALGLAAPHVRPARASRRLTVFAAASLKNALDAVSTLWSKETGQDTAISYAASSALAKQIEQGAPADIFFSADLDWMRYLAGQNLLAADTVVNLLGNEIVLIAPKDREVETAIEKDFPLAALLGDGRLAMADVKAVPAGKYGKAALESLRVWDSVENKIAQAENVRAALKLVAAGEAPLGVVYATDAVAEPAVKVVGVFPPESHSPIIYPAAIIAGSQDPHAAAFLKFLQSPKAQALFKDQGFTILAPAATN
jgi:molybdate transport system substrate-binding protein